MLISLLLMIGIQESARANAVIVVLKVSVVMLFILLRLGVHQSGELHAFHSAQHRRDRASSDGAELFARRGVVFFAFIGFDAVSTAAQETKNPQRDMPIGIIGSLVVCTILYVLFSHVLTGIVNYTETEQRRAGGRGNRQNRHRWLKTAIKLAIIAGYTSVILVMLLGQSRVFYSMSRDGLLPKLFSDIHPKFRTPWRSNLLFMVFVGLFAAFAPIQIVGEMTSIGTLFAFVLVCGGNYGDAPHAPGTAAAVQDAAGSVCADARNRRQSVPDGGLGWENWAAIDHLDGDRTVYLLRVQQEAQLA